MESLFGYVPADKNKNDQKKDGASSDTPPQFIQIIDPKKSQNLAILLKALNVTTEEVCDALNEGVFTRFHNFFFPKHQLHVHDIYYMTCKRWEENELYFP